MNTNRTIKLFGVDVQVNESGLLRLNDIHQAAGGDVGRSPRHWLANKSTKELVAADKSLCVEASHGGPHKGTYASEELAIVYGAWVSAEFCDQVFKNFKALTRGDSSTSNPGQPQTDQQ